MSDIPISAPTEEEGLTEVERSHLISKLRQNYPSQGCDVCDQLLAKLEQRGSVLPHVRFAESPKCLTRPPYQKRAKK